VDEAYERKAAPEVVATVVTVNTADKLSQDSKVSSLTGSGSIIRRRSSSKEVQERAHTKKILQAKRVTQAMKQVTVLIERSKALLMGHLVAVTNAQMYIPTSPELQLPNMS
jgi:Na+/citrate or Na+/malate symporter